MGNSEPSAKEIRCRFCDKLLCKGSSLRRQGTTVVCKDPAFERLVNPPKTNGGNHCVFGFFLLKLILFLQRNFSAQIQPVSESLVESFYYQEMNQHMHYKSHH